MRVESERTEVVQDEHRVLECVLGFISRARRRLDLSASYVGVGTGEDLVSALRDARSRGIRARLLTEVSSENVRAMKAAVGYLEIRHVSGLGGNSWGVSDEEYLSSLSVGEFNPSLPLIYSNAASLVAEHQSIFDALWSRGEPLDERLHALDSGTDLPEFEILRDSGRIKEQYLSLVASAKKEIQLLWPTTAAFRRDSDIGIIDAIATRSWKGVKVRLLTPLDPVVLSRLSELSGRGSPGNVAFRPIAQAGEGDTVTVLVVDLRASLTIDERAPGKQGFEDSVGSAMLATRDPRIRLSIRFFERVWKESELREAEEAAKTREENSRKRAELMQDILTHDIRNFNQVARLNAELLQEGTSDKDAAKMVSAILRAIDGSTKLIERAKRLGAILSASDVELRVTSLKKSFDRSLSLVRKSNPASKIKVTGKLTGSVFADDLLDEVFVNLLSNSAKYADDEHVHLAVSEKLDELSASSRGSPRQCWKISISDWGTGIPEAQKHGIFSRYLQTAKGSGLGLSIVHALVTERYKGKVELRDRVEGDPSKGTTVDIWLPQAQPDR